ncbi:hypothetical protein [Actinocatenispora rupis]|uniref:hypothetical protein n=1 Tax=Actinocatenispora rupis TaxID=519421 RepID=UPI001944A9F4|nr:hypothetical protein [Actinocatenispora rupis]
MAGQHPLRTRLHRATHRVPAVPRHVEHPTGHQGKTSQRHGTSTRNHHSRVRQPRVLVAWQRRVAHFLGQESS